jgi:hypothetical protein
MAGFDLLERATAKAFDKLATPTDGSPEADIKFYENLAPQAFDVIAATYGPDALVQYVTAMEAQRVKKGSNNGK